MAETRIGSVTNLREGDLPERDNSARPKLRLKNGSEADAKDAYVTWQMLEAIETRTPEKLEALVAIARRERVASSMRDQLRKGYPWFTSAGDMECVARDVIQSAIRQTPDGSVLVFPFDIKTQSDKDIFSQIQREDDDIILRRKARRDGDYGRSK